MLRSERSDDTALIDTEDTVPKSSQKSLQKIFVKGGATTVILALLSERPMHGYELIQTIRERTDGIFDFSDGTVYPLLYNLRDRGLLKSKSETSDEGRTRRVYHLTTAGERALRSQVDDWQLFVKGMGLALGR